MKSIMYLLAGMLLLNACSEKAIIPKSDFAYQLANPELATFVTVVPAHEPIRFINNSENGSKFEWKIGQLNFSYEKEPVYTFTTSGTYSISLTTISASGDRQVITKEVKVVQRVLNRIVVESLVWNATGALPTWSANKSAALQAEVGYKIITDPTGAMHVLLQRSSVVENVSEAVTPVQMPIPGGLVFEPDFLPALVVDLYGKDETGKYLAFASGKIAGGLIAGYEPDTGLYTIRANAGGTQIRLEYRYE